jgi:hypothetical protein
MVDRLATKVGAHVTVLVASDVVIAIEEALNGCDRECEVFAKATHAPFISGLALGWGVVVATRNMKLVRQGLLTFCLVATAPRPRGQAD